MSPSPPTLKQRSLSSDGPADRIHLNSDECIQHSNVRNNELQIECMNCNGDVDVCTKCPAIKRMKFLFRKKYIGIKSSMKNVLRITKQPFCTTVDDFFHIRHHMDHSRAIRNTVRGTFREEFESEYAHSIRRCNKALTSDAIQDTELEQKYDDSEAKTIEDITMEQQMNGFFAFLTRALSVTDSDTNTNTSHTQNESDIDTNIQDNTQTNNIRYIGRIEDEKWYKYDTDNEDMKDEDIYHGLVKNMGVFRCQQRHGFSTNQYHGLMHLRPRYRNIKEEVLHNPFYRIGIDCWNQTWRKSDVFYKSFARRYINTQCDGSYNDRVTQSIKEWKKGEIINLAQILTLKLYTDFDKLQYELKKCFRFETDSDIFALRDFNPDINNNVICENTKESMFTLEQRLCVFYFWRNRLLTVLHKYSRKMNGNKALYHGVNAKMIINNGARNGSMFCGPLSTSSSYHVARTFATSKGMVLKINTQFPRLDHCKAFDASYISDYYEEQEFLISSVYLRITAVYTKSLVREWGSFDDMDDMDDNIPNASKSRSIFFALHLFRQQIFSISVHLEYWLSAFLYLQCKYDEMNDNYDNARIKRTEFVDLLQEMMTNDSYHCADYRFDRIINILWNKFENFRRFPNRHQTVRFDIISDNLKPYFLDFDGFNIRKQEKYIVSFNKISKVFENVKEIHFMNNYMFDDITLRHLIQYLQRNNNNKLRKIKFLYYDYELHPTECNTFFDPSKLSENLRKELNQQKWRIKHKNIAKTGYEIVLHCDDRC